jgi:DnaJ family protein C protein 3
MASADDGDRHVAQLNPSSIEPHLQTANLLFFSLNDYDRSTAQLRKCLHSDPDSKPCSKLFRRIKTYEKLLVNVRGLREERLWNSANKILMGVGEDTGVIDDVKEDIADLKKDGIINEHCPQALMADLQEMVCDGFTEVCNITLSWLQHPLTRNYADGQTRKGPTIL